MTDSVVNLGDGNTISIAGSTVGLAAETVAQVGEWDGSRLFLSHSHQDAELALAFVSLIIETTDLAPSDVFCSSLSRSGIPAGHDFVDYIRHALVNARLVLALITPNFLSSEFCLCELGASWGLSLDLVPLVGDEATLHRMRGVLGQIQALRYDRPDEIDHLVDRVVERMDTTAYHDRLSGARAGLIESVTRIRTGADSDHRYS